MSFLSVRVEVEVDDSAPEDLRQLGEKLATSAADAVQHDGAVVRVVHAASVTRRG